MDGDGLDAREARVLLEGIPEALSRARLGARQAAEGATVGLDELLTLDTEADAGPDAPSSVP